MEKLISIANPFTASMYKVKSFRLSLIFAMVDSKKRIIDLEAGWPGSVGDGRIWSCCTLINTMNAWISQLPTGSLPTGVDANGDEVNEDIPPFILGDSAYPNTRHMVTTNLCLITLKLRSITLRREECRKLNNSLGVIGLMSGICAHSLRWYCIP